MNTKVRRSLVYLSAFIVYPLLTTHSQPVIGSLKQDVLSCSLGLSVLSPNGKYIASNWLDTIFFWDAQTGELLKTFYTRDSSANAQSMCFTPDSGKLFVSQQNSSVIDLANGKIGIAPGGDLRSISPDGRYGLFYNYYNNVYSIDLYSLETNQLINRYSADSDPGINAWFSSDSRYAAVYCNNQTNLWNIESGIKTVMYPDFGHVENVVFLHDMKTMCVYTGKWWLLCGPLTGDIHRKINASNGFLSKDGRSLITIDTGSRIIQFILIESGTVTKTIPLSGTPFRIAEFTPDEQSILFTRNDGSFDFYAIKLNKTVYKHKNPTADSLFGARFFDNGNRIMAGTTDEFAIMDSLSGEVLKRIPLKATRIGGGIDISPDQKKIAINLYDGGISIIDAETGQAKFLVEDTYSNTGDVSIAFSPDGEKILYGSAVNIRLVANGEILHIFNLDGTGAKTKKLVQPLSLYYQPIRVAQYSPDGNRILTLDSTGKQLILWDAKTYQMQYSIRDAHNIKSACFSSDSQFIAATFEDISRISMWDAKDGKPVRQFNPVLRKNDHFSQNLIPFNVINYTVNQAIFSSDNRYLISRVSTSLSANNSDTIQVWDTATGVILGTINKGIHNLIHFELSPDGTKILLVSETSVEVLDFNRLLTLAGVQVSGVDKYQLYH